MGNWDSTLGIRWSKHRCSSGDTWAGAARSPGENPPLTAGRRSSPLAPDPGTFGAASQERPRHLDPERQLSPFAPIPLAEPNRRESCSLAPTSTSAAGRWGCAETSRLFFASLRRAIGKAGQQPARFANLDLGCISPRRKHCDIIMASMSYKVWSLKETDILEMV